MLIKKEHKFLSVENSFFSRSTPYHPKIDKYLEEDDIEINNDSFTENSFLLSNNLSKSYNPHETLLNEGDFQKISSSEEKTRSFFLKNLLKKLFRKFSYHQLLIISDIYNIIKDIELEMSKGTFCHFRSFIENVEGYLEFLPNDSGLKTKLKGIVDRISKIISLKSKNILYLKSMMQKFEEAFVESLEFWLNNKEKPKIVNNLEGNSFFSDFSDENLDVEQKEDEIFVEFISKLKEKLNSSLLSTNFKNFQSQTTKEFCIKDALKRLDENIDSRTAQILIERLNFPDEFSFNKLLDRIKNENIDKFLEGNYKSHDFFINDQQKTIFIHNIYEKIRKFPKEKILVLNGKFFLNKREFREYMLKMKEIMLSRKEQVFIFKYLTKEGEKTINYEDLEYLLGNPKVLNQIIDHNIEENDPFNVFKKFYNGNIERKKKLREEFMKQDRELNGQINFYSFKKVIKNENLQFQEIDIEKIFERFCVKCCEEKNKLNQIVNYINILREIQ